MTIKAVRAQILLGDIPLNVYQLPDSRYKLAGRNVTDAIGQHDSSLREKMGVKSLKDLPGADKSLREVRADTGETFIPVSPLDAAAYWMKMAIAGNIKAAAIMMALTVESIERRADEAFGVHRSEGDRNQRTKTLIDFILNNPKAWTVHFNPRWRQEACRVTGYRWEASRPMAQFISMYIYKVLPKDVYDRLMEVNAERKSRHHQFFDELADNVVLKEHIQQVGGLLRVSKNKPHFKQLFSDAFSDGIQGDFDFEDEVA